MTATGAITTNTDLGINSLDESSGSISLMFAKLQITLAQANRSKAESIIKDIQSTQAEATEYAEMINTLRSAKTSTVDDKGNSKEADDSSRASVVKANKEALKSMGISDSDLNKDKFSKDDLELIISNLQTKQDTIGSNIQQQMVYVQDYIGQYNAYTSGSTSAISEANSTLKTIAQGR